MSWSSCLVRERAIARTVRGDWVRAALRSSASLSRRVNSHSS